MNMKISNDSPPTTESDVRNRAVDSTDTEQKSEPSPFSQVLAKKHSTGESARDLKSKLVNTSNPMLTGIPAELFQFDRRLEAPKIESKHMVELPSDLQDLVQEIAVVSGGREVHIEMNSNVLKGLHVRIEKQDGVVAIQFQSTSEDIARLLTRNLDGLAQSLADRGISAAEIRVVTTQETTRRWSQTQKSRSDSNSGRGSQSGRQGQR